MIDVLRMVLDTNVFVAAGFRPASASARLVEAVRQGRSILVWNEATRSEARSVLERIPRLSWSAFEAAFGDEGRFDGPIRVDEHDGIPDVADRKFAALAAATGAILVSSDRGLLEGCDRDRVTICTPGEALRRVDR